MTTHQLQDRRRQEQRRQADYQQKDYLLRQAQVSKKVQEKVWSSYSNHTSTVKKFIFPFYVESKKREFTDSLKSISRCILILTTLTAKCYCFTPRIFGGY